MNLSLVLKALGDPTRLYIFQQLLTRKHCVRSMSKKTGLTESAISQHIKVLKEADLVYGERFGYHIHYLPKQETIDQLCEEMENMRQMSLDFDRDSGVCNCEFRQEEEK